jgi:VWFA-related protein
MKVCGNFVPLTTPEKGLIIISDGMDNHSRYTASELRLEAIEADVQIYTISLYSPPAYLKPIQLQKEHQALLFLADLAETTGGMQFIVRDTRDIDKAAATIGRALRNQYVIEYVPRGPISDGAGHRTTGRWHTIDVKINVPGLKAHARSGYYSDWLICSPPSCGSQKR